MISKASIPYYFRNWKKHFIGKKSYIVDYGRYKFSVRPRTHDIFTISEVVGKKSYSPTLVRNNKFPVIVDVGANIGAFTVWSSFNLFPRRILAIEMEPDNYKTLLENIRANKLNGLVTPVNKAIYKRNTIVGIKTPFFKGSIDRLNENITNNKVDSITLRSLVGKYSLTKIDFLKIDIEGSEKFILTEENREIFIKKVKYVYLEAHSFLDYRPKLALNYFSSLGFKTKKRYELRTTFTLMIEAYNPNL